MKQFRNQNWEIFASLFQFSSVWFILMCSLHQPLSSSGNEVNVVNKYMHTVENSRIKIL
jgi:hypothetical protein